MSKILIWKKPVPGSDIDILHATDYRSFYDSVMKAYGRLGGNWGNKVWYQAICSMLETEENELSYGTDQSPDAINESYDLIVYPMANFFGEQFCRDTSGLVRAFSGIRIPVYIIACGAQAKDYDSLDELIRKIGDPAKKFIDAIYATGGEFALRGSFTKEFFALLGYPSAVVTGCPSLFQLGPDLHVEKCNSSSVPKTVLNGKIKSFEGLMRELPESQFLAQDEFLDCLYDPSFFSKRSLKSDIKFVNYHSAFQAELLGQGRIKMFADTNDWLRYLRTSGFDYAFGTKIHGSIMPILAGIPATVLSVDSRTKEMAEFYDIPSIPFQPGHQYTMDELLSAYAEADYTDFNSRFADRFAAFEQFLQKYGIVKIINCENRYFAQESERDLEHLSLNQEAFREYSERLKREKLLLSAGSIAWKLKNG